MRGVRSAYVSLRGNEWGVCCNDGAGRVEMYMGEIKIVRDI